MVAGYCWNWIKEGKVKSDVHDVVIPEYNFGMSWNLASSNTWLLIKNQSMKLDVFIHVRDWNLIM